MTFENWLTVYFITLEAAVHDDLRPGQWFFNLLDSERPDIATKIRGTVRYDPFYDDAKIPAALRRIAELW